MKKVHRGGVWWGGVRVSSVVEGKRRDEKKRREEKGRAEERKAEQRRGEREAEQTDTRNRRSTPVAFLLVVRITKVGASSPFPLKTLTEAPRAASRLRCRLLDHCGGIPKELGRRLKTVVLFHGIQNILFSRPSLDLVAPLQVAAPTG